MSIDSVAECTAGRGDCRGADLDGASVRACVSDQILLYKI